MAGWQPRESNKDWHQQELWLHGHVNSLTELMFSYPLSSVISPPLQRIQKELAPQFLSLTSRNCRKTSYQIMYFYHIEATMRYCILHRWCPVSFTYSRRCHYNQVKVVRQTKDTYCDKKAVERERAANNTRKLTTALISECRHCFYAARSGKKCGVLHKLMSGKAQWRVHTDTQQQAPPARPPSSPIWWWTSSGVV